eukprot:8694728-Pyramimonas_sp.AAC.1
MQDARETERTTNRITWNHQENVKKAPIRVYCPPGGQSSRHSGNNLPHRSRFTGPAAYGRGGLLNTLVPQSEVGLQLNARDL